ALGVSYAVSPSPKRGGKWAEVAPDGPPEVDAAATDYAKAVARQQLRIEPRRQPLITYERARFGGERGSASSVDVFGELSVGVFGDAVQVDVGSRLKAGFGHEQGEVAVPHGGGAARKRPGEHLVQ